eukprot:jgi/Bigna1/71861/fgenesh1_pg.17_\
MLYMLDVRAKNSAGEADQSAEESFLEGTTASSPLTGVAATGGGCVLIEMTFEFQSSKVDFGKQYIPKISKTLLCFSSLEDGHLDGTHLLPDILNKLTGSALTRRPRTEIDIIGGGSRAKKKDAIFSLRQRISTSKNRPNTKAFLQPTESRTPPPRWNRCDHTSAYDRMWHKLSRTPLAVTRRARGEWKNNFRMTGRDVVIARSLIVARQMNKNVCGPRSPIVARSLVNFSNQRRAFGKAAASEKHGDPSRHVLALQGVTKEVSNNRALFQDVSLSFYHGAKIGVLGHNGSGKSSLLKILAGVDEDYDGEVVQIESGIKIGYLEQEPELDPDKTVDENIMDGIKEKQQLLKEYESISEEFAKEDADFDALVERQAELQTEIDALDCWDLNHEVETARRALNCPPGDSDVENLSGGERRRVALCRLLLSKPDVLLLDEPTNHLDADSVRWLEDLLEDYKGLVMCVTHDRYFLDNVAGWILEVDQGNVYPCQGNYSKWLQKRTERYELMGKREKARAREMQKELSWIQSGSKGQTKKNKARQKRYEELADAKIDLNDEGGKIFIPKGPRLGEKVIEAKNISKAFDGRQLVSDACACCRVITKIDVADDVVGADLNFTLHPGSIVGIIGPNGTGKTTLLNCLAGVDEPDKGSVNIGQTVKLGYVSQHRDDMDEKRKVWQEVCGSDEYIDMGDGQNLKARHFLAQFNFRGTTQEKFIRDLSGGERNRCHMAKILKTGVNVLFLDEPTNDLDVDTLRALEESLKDFAGSVMIVSHDRWFLDRICTEIIEFHRDGRVECCDGNYTTYAKEKKKDLGWGA